MSGTDPARAGAPALDPEDVARANLYGLIGRLFYGPVDPNLLAEICGAQAGNGEGGLVAGWRNLQEACRGAYPAVVRQEYDTLFVGVGKTEVTPYLSGYADTGPERYFVRLRDQLAAWGLTQHEAAPEFEDHISGVADVMRWLIENGRPIEVQQQFFEEYVLRGAAQFFAAVQKSPSASFYKAVAAFAATFLDVERAAFEFESRT